MSEIIRRSKGLLKFPSVFIFICCLSLQSYAQVAVKGSVVDKENDTPLAGVTVTVRGTNNTAVTDAAGNFTINAPSGSVLVFSYVGYGSTEAPVGSSGVVNVAMSTASEGLSEVVVVGYGERSRRDITSAISTVSAKDIEKSTALSPELALQGQMTGVNVTSAGGNPTARPTVRIRGVSTFGNADPLYVIDGVPFIEGGAGAVVDAVNDPTRRGPVNIYTIVNPNDIESISVLKDASASAIYGVRAANGVVLITTKKGSRGKVRVEFNAQYGVQKVPRKVDVLKTADYTKFYTDIYNANPDVNNNVPVPIENAEFFGPLWDPSNPDYIGSRGFYDWQDAVINKNSQLQDYNLRASGGTENTIYNFSIGYANNDGPFVGYNAERYSLSTNLVSRIGKFIEVGMNLRGVRTDTKNPGDNASLDVYKAAPWQKIYDENGPYGYAPLWGLTGPLTPGSFPIQTLYGKQYVAYHNVLGELATSERNMQNQTAIGSAYVQIQPISGLKIKGTLNGQQTNIFNKNYVNFDNWWFGENPGNPYGILPDAQEGTRPSQLDVGTSTTVSWMKAVNVDYMKEFGDHHIDITLDASQQDYKWSNTGVGRPILTEDPTLRYFSVTGEEKGYYELRAAYTLIGYLARVSYNFNNQYYIEGVVRRDGSSRLAPGKRFRTFPAGSIGWRISNEKFMQNQQFINDLKIRAGYGETGNEQTTAGWKYISIAGVVPPSYNVGNPQTNNLGIAYVNFPNKDLTWEIGRTLNVGFDAVLFNNAVNFTMDYYYKKTVGIIQNVELAPTTGIQSLADLNIADVSNTGFEFQLGYTKNFGEFGFSVNANLTTVKNQVLTLANHTALREGGLEEGLPIGFIYGYKMGGIFQDQADIDKYNQSVDDQNSTEQAPGDIYFQNLYGAPTPGSTALNKVPDSVLNANDRTYLGKTIPGYYGGITLTGTYKNFDLSVFFQGRGDVQKYNDFRAAGEGMNGYGRNQFASVLNAWTPDNRNTSLPRAVYGDPNGNLRYSDRFVEDAGFLRLQNVQLGYNLPQKLLQRTKSISGLRVYVTGINMFTITNWSGLDPENDLYPSTRQFLVGLKASF
jgi:TonB-linked SusC/RagA family outer membrane protein